MFHLSDEQWTFIQPLLPPVSVRGRPPIDQRLTLEGVLWKLSTRSPWYDMPSVYPSYQTCYRRYLLWKRTGLLKEIYRLLYRDLYHRGGLDISQAITEKRIRLSMVGTRWTFTFSPDLENTWQASVARLILYYWLGIAMSALKKASLPGL